VAGAFFESRRKAIAVREPDLAGNLGQFFVGLRDQPDRLLDTQVRQVAHRGSANLTETQPTQVLETQV
jgi:hypothetical protein